MGRHFMRCIIGGVVIAALLCVLATVSLLLKGDAAFRAVGISYPKAILVYLITGAFGGALVGLSARWIANRWVSAVIGAVIATIFAVTLRMTRHHVPAWTHLDAIVMVLYALLMGVPGGLIYHEIFVGRRKQEPRAKASVPKRNSAREDR